MSETSSDHALDPATSAQVLEQYKAKLSDLGNIGSRHTAMTAYYVSLTTAIFGLISLKESALSDIQLSVLSILCLVGSLVCTLWYFSNIFFRNLFRSKLTILTRMEKLLPYQTFEEESQIMLSQKINGWMRIERFIPVLFGIIFISLLAIRAIMSIQCAIP